MSALGTRNILRFSFLLALQLLITPWMARPADAGTCPGVYGLVEPSDGTFEGDFSWQDRGGWVVPPDYGAYAQRMPVGGHVESIRLQFRPRFVGVKPPTMTFRLYVWEDDEAQPGAVVTQFDVTVPTPVAWPLLWTVEVPVTTGDLSRPWCGVRIPTPPPGQDFVAIAADLNGIADVPPKTLVAPGSGYPSGWQDAALVFGPVSSLGIEARMCDIGVVETTAEWAGGGDFAPIVRNGTWDYERFLDGEYDAPSCAYSWPDTFGSVPDADGWALSPESNPAAGLGPASQVSTDLGFLHDADVEGQALFFHDPAFEGYPPGHRGLYESPVIRQSDLGFGPGMLAYRFNAATDPLAPPEVATLQWVIGSRVMLPDLTWSAWRDLRCAVAPGPQAFVVPLLWRGATTQVRMGVENPSGVLIQQKKTGTDKGTVTKPKPVITGPTQGYKPVPQFKQGSDYQCMTMAAAQCLAYWAANGYSEILPAGTSLRDKHKKLGDELKKIMEQPPAGKGKGMKGIEEYLKGKKIYHPQQPPGVPPRKPLFQKIYADTSAKWDSLKNNLARNHDVMLGFQAYKVVNGVPQVVKNDDGNPIRHAVTAAEIVEEGEKKTVKVANPHGKTVDEVTDKNKDATYESFEAEVDPNRKTIPQNLIKLKNKRLQDEWKCDYFCVVEINVIRPEPANDPPGPQLIASLVTARALRHAATEGATGPDTLVQYDYALGPNHDEPLNYFALEIEVPYYDVQSPPGWTWEPLPSIPPGGLTCDAAFGPAGIAWRALVPLPPGQGLAGFSFKAHERYESDPEAVDTYIGATSYIGVLGFTAGPAPPDDPAGVTPIAPPPGLSALQGIPNPARGGVDLTFTSSLAGPGRLTVYDPAGREVRAFPLRAVTAGSNRVRWDRVDASGRGVPPGIYFYRIEVAGRSAGERVILIE